MRNIPENIIENSQNRSWVQEKVVYIRAFSYLFMLQEADLFPIVSDNTQSTDMPLPEVIDLELLQQTNYLTIQKDIL